MQPITPILFATFATLLLAYTYCFVDPDHYLLINTGWTSNLIESNVLCYLLAALGICLALVYRYIGKLLFSKTLIMVHLIAYIILLLIVVLWDRNIFSLQQAIDSQSYNTLGQLKGEYKNVLDKDHLYRVLFWIFLTFQTVVLLNLLLSFSKARKLKF